MKAPKYIKEEDGEMIVEIKFIVWPVIWFVEILIIAGYLGIITDVPKWFHVKVVHMFSRFWVFPAIKK